jgi:excisionase family DNA binding protein
MEVICMETDAFYTLLDLVMKRVQEKTAQKEDKWITSDEAMRRLRITSKTTLQRLRDQGKIRFTQPKRKLLLFDKDSIEQYLEKNARETF